MKKEKDTLGDRLRTIRGSLTQTELAEMLEIPQGYISRYEKGVVKPSIHYIFNVCKAFNVNMEWLLFGEGNRVGFVSGNGQKIDPKVQEVVNTLKARPNLAKAIADFLSRKECEQLLESINAAKQHQLQAIVTLLE